MTATENKTTVTKDWGWWKGVAQGKKLCMVTLFFNLTWKWSDGITLATLTTVHFWC